MLQGVHTNQWIVRKPPKHDKWDPDIIDNDEEARKNAKIIRSKIVGWTNSIINEYCKIESVKEIDPEGVSEYLAFEDFSLEKGNENTMSNGLDNDSNISKIKNNPSIINRISVQGLKEEGIDNQEGEIHNNDNSGMSNSSSSGGSTGNGNSNIVTKSQGSKSLFEEEKPMKLQRIMPVSVVNGIYKIVLIPTNDYEKVEIELKAVGEDSRKENIPIIKYTINSKTTP